MLVWLPFLSYNMVLGVKKLMLTEHHRPKYGVLKLQTRAAPNCCSLVGRQRDRLSNRLLSPSRERTQSKPSTFCSLPAHLLNSVISPCWKPKHYLVIIMLSANYRRPGWTAPAFRSGRLSIYVLFGRLFSHQETKCVPAAVIWPNPTKRTYHFTVCFFSPFSLLRIVQ